MPNIPMDPQQMQQVLFNLIINARQAVGNAGSVAVSTSARPTAELEPGFPGPAFAEVSVQDDGPGIPADKLGEIFKPFFTTKNQGTGLGLPISRKIVEAHGGILHVRSTPGEGATFYVWLPRTRETA
jgi:signal transduction histidine kinase